MLNRVKPITGELIEKALQLAQYKDDQTYVLTRVLFKDVPAEDLTHLNAQDLHKIAQHSVHILNRFSGTEPLVDLTRMDTIKGAPLLISICQNDMPFIVDSCLNILAETGCKIRLISHPVLLVKGQYGALNIVEQREQNTKALSFMHLHIEPSLSKDQLDALQNALIKVLHQVHEVVSDWRPMLNQLEDVVRQYHETTPPLPVSELAEAIHFVGWLANHHFTFMGMRNYDFSGDTQKGLLRPSGEPGLGLLRDPEVEVLRKGSQFVTLTPEVLEFLHEPLPIIVAKANLKANVHRADYLDYIGLKRFDAQGYLLGELRIVGMFTSFALNRPSTEVPLIRRKLNRVMDLSGYAPASHAGKELTHVLNGYPRDELFQIDTEQLLEFATIIADLAERPRVRVLPRLDKFDRFVSVIVYVPQTQFNTDNKQAILHHLAKTYDGHVSAIYPSLSDSRVARLHVIIGRREGETPNPDRADIEHDIEELILDWEDRLLKQTDKPEVLNRYLKGFHSSYRARFSTEQILADMAVFECMDAQNPFEVKLNIDQNQAVNLRLYHLGEPISLSDRVPMIENLGFKVISEQTYAVQRDSNQTIYVHDMALQTRETDIEVIATSIEKIETYINAFFKSDAEDDHFNLLVASCGLQWQQANVFRAFARYLHQIQLPYSQTYIAQTLSKYAKATQHLWDLFEATHNPRFESKRNVAQKKHLDAITHTLSEIKSLDEDRIISRMLGLIKATLRTNYYQYDEDAGFLEALAFKFDPTTIEDLPRPKPFREIFVYSKRVEGVHLRGGMIARGGLRWSDRQQDFRTEILGLVKAQMVKNAVIVPVGAKGGFVTKRMPQNPDRQTFLNEGIACYKIFINALLQITDNLKGDKIIPARDVLRLDGDDPYLVVAADKGTATFSDIANSISQEHGFWLSDAFASGGSAGYDHKKMGVTARGAWEAVKRHFMEMDIDIQTQPFTAIGVGDMSGDVFGNGMLLSKATKLIAAFDHRDIFIDPAPDSELSYHERERLFALGRSSWQDYDRSVLSQGGIVVSRLEKSIELPKKAAAAIQLDINPASPNDIIKAILKCNADLLWCGGIGTYVRAGHETDHDAGDRANDAVRITADELNVKVIGEGANLGVTQPARIAFAQRGGRINTDAIDNSAGVNSSDLEVNIKIAMAHVMQQSGMDIETRNHMLVHMTDDVANLCLRANYLQTLSISLAQRLQMRAFDRQVRLIQELEAAGHLDREIEYLPDDLQVAERREQMVPFSRPELAVLLAYAKNTLYDILVSSDVASDPYLKSELVRYFPAQLVKSYPDAVEHHRLRREIIATMLANAMINNGGPGFIRQIKDFTGAHEDQIALAYVAARDSFSMIDLNSMIDDLDHQVDGETQLELYAEIQTLLTNQTVWFLRNVSLDQGLSDIVATYKNGVKKIRNALGELMSDYLANAVHDQSEGFQSGETPEPVALHIAELSVLTFASDIVKISHQANCDVLEGAKVYFGLLHHLNLGHITERAHHITVGDYYDRMALDRALANLFSALRRLSAAVLHNNADNAQKALDEWLDINGDHVSRTMVLTSGLTDGELTVSRLSVAAGLLGDLLRD